MTGVCHELDEPHVRTRAQIAQAGGIKGLDEHRRVARGQAVRLQGGEEHFLEG